jgi:hypothetical protein
MSVISRPTLVMLAMALAATLAGAILDNQPRQVIYSNGTHAPVSFVA